MDTSVCRSLTFISFITVTLLLSSINGQEEGPCENVPSETWKGPCVNSDHCKTQCMEKEGASFGNCNVLVCNCTFDCKNICTKPSGLWKGLCFDNPGCSRQCREKENSLRGGCIGAKCLCFYNCNQ